MFVRERERLSCLLSSFVCLNMNKEGAVTFKSSFSRSLYFLLGKLVLVYGPRFKMH